MSWAAKRKTTKAEDMSYCLLGIFNIQMPLLYGEGAEQAFHRLQSQILKETHDQSWLAWRSFPGHVDEDEYTLCGVLTKSPAYFWNCRDIIVCNPGSICSPVIETNLGIEMKLPIIKRGSLKHVLLDCRWRHDFHNVVTIPLIEQDGQHFRESVDTDVMPEQKWLRTKTSSVVFSPRSRKQRSAVEKCTHYYLGDFPLSLQVVEVFSPNA
jgi:hypothetical protein